MCGIVGKINYKSHQPVEPDLIRKMSDTIVYRGPDAWGTHTDGPVGLGHRRLSIIDLSELGRQPMSSDDGNLWITFNGEIYNFQVLRKELIQKGYHFKSRTDTEVILNLYKEYGEQCLDHLQGMFAFSIWDRAKSRLFLARDRIGKKPLFYWDNGRSLIFASEIKAILADPMVKRTVNYEALSDYFKYLYVPDPKTIYKDIHKLQPGHCMTCTADGVRVKEYWDVSFANPLSRDENNISEELLSLLRESVRMRMISDVPLGAFLSGGIDSSGVVALMAQQQPDPVTTCSIGFDSRQHDEVRFARSIAQRFKTDHHEFTVKNRAAAILKELAYYFDEPFADASAVPTYYVSKLARQKVTVALSGDGGDENFAGYEKYYLDDIENRIRSRIPAFIRKPVFPQMARILSPFRHRILRKGATLLDTLSFESDFGYYLTNTELRDNLWHRLTNDDTKKEVGDYDPFELTRHYYHKADTDNHLSKILYVDLKTYLPGDILVKVDRMSMANSLEVRAPILDQDVIAFAAAIPQDLKYYNSEKKYILKRSFSSVLPRDIMDRKKMGFSVPLSQWMRGELRGFSQNYLFNADSGLSNFFEPQPLADIWQAHQTGRRNYSVVLWSLLMFELWYQNFMA